MGSDPAKRRVTGIWCRSAAISAAEHPATPEPTTIRESSLVEVGWWGVLLKFRRRWVLNVV